MPAQRIYRTSGIPRQTNSSPSSRSSPSPHTVRAIVSTMRLSAILTVIPLLALVGASPTPPKPTLANGAVRFKRQGGVCTPRPSSSSNAAAQPTASDSATASASASDSASATASQSSAATPSESAIIGVNGTYPIPEVIDHGYYNADPAEGDGRRIRVAGRNDMCVTIQGASLHEGALVAM